MLLLRHFVYFLIHCHSDPEVQPHGLHRLGRTAYKMAYIQHPRFLAVCRGHL
jgi:hypothetical protein